MAINSATDVNSKTVYLNMVNKERGKINLITNKLNRTLDAKEKCYNWLLARKESIYKSYKIELDNYKIEFVDKQYNSEKSLETKAIYYLRHPNGEDRQLIIQLAKYCSLLRSEVEIQQKLEVSRIKLNMSYREFQKYLFDYYSKVHKVLLQGDAYKFGKGIGTIFLRTIDMTTGARNRIDFAKTRANKLKLLAEGKKLYNEQEAKQCELENIPYDGVPYIVLRNETKLVVLDITNSKYFTSRGRISFAAKSYINLKYRGMSYQDIIDKYCPTEESIADLQADLYTKRSILGIMNPGITQKFDRKI
jgi:hypothetical protein